MRKWRTAAATGLPSNAIVKALLVFPRFWRTVRSMLGISGLRRMLLKVQTVQRECRNLEGKRQMSHAAWIQLRLSLLRALPVAHTTYKELVGM